MKFEEQPVGAVELGGLLAAVEEKKKGGCRLVVISCTKLAEDSFEITYSFDKDYAFSSLRLTVPKKAQIPSISGTYGGSFLYENEIRELFGLDFKGINVDYQGHLYMKKIKEPFSVDTKKGGA